MVYGNKPADGGFLILSDDEKNDLLSKEPNAVSLLKRFISAKEFLNNKKRWCLWLVDVESDVLRELPIVLQKIDQTKEVRISSKKSATVNLAERPALFAEIRQPNSDYLLIPRHSSENRRYIPIGFFDKNFIVADSCSCIPNATLFDFGVLSSAMHMAWVRSVCGRIKSDYRYSNTIVYNNFPWPQSATNKQKQAIETAAQVVLDTRAQFPNSSLASLYDPLVMPQALSKAHQKLNTAVDRAYAKRKFTGDQDRVAFLFELYQQLSSPLESIKPPRRKQADLK